jgi:hypothetical protein
VIPFTFLVQEKKTNSQERMILLAGTLGLGKISNHFVWVDLNGLTRLLRDQFKVINTLY